MSSARRCLFGRPTPEQRERARTWLDEGIKRIRKQESEKWGFDFELDMPLLSDSEYKYEVISESMVPEFYRTKVISINASMASVSALDISSTTLTPLSSPGTSEKEDHSFVDHSLMDHNSSFEDEEEPKKFQFREPPTPRKTPMKRTQKITDYMAVSRKKSSISPKLSPKDVIYTPKSRRPTVRRSPY